jgi:hypothetical protein
MSDSADTPVDTASIDPREEAIREFDNHAEAEPAPTLDRSEAAVDEGKDLPTPSPRDVTAGDKDDKQTSRQD